MSNKLETRGLSKLASSLKNSPGLSIPIVQCESLEACGLGNISHIDFCTEAFCYRTLIFPVSQSGEWSLQPCRCHETPGGTESKIFSFFFSKIFSKKKMTVASFPGEMETVGVYVKRSESGQMSGCTGAKTKERQHGGWLPGQLQASG